MLFLFVVETVFTVSEVARVLRQLEGRFALTPRGVRYYARTGMVVPSGRMTARKNARTTRLYSVVDVALLRLICQLQRQHVHERAVWGLLVYRGDELRQLIANGAGTCVVDDRAALAVGTEDRQPPRRLRIDIAFLLRGLGDRLTSYRRVHPKVWTGLAWIEASAAAEQVHA
jgi:DNA-binding transcriptional MerR regulator